MTSARPQICFLLALWGKSYISMFCDLSLRTLLAKGNIPALAEEYDCIFTLLTKEEDIPFFERQEMFPKLRKYCEIRYLDIKDTLFAKNHSATLNIALERGVRSFGPDMLNTYFIFLMADYIFADASLSALLPHIRQGVSVITAGNYQVVEEEVLDDLMQRTDPVSGTIAIPSRELVGWSLAHMHPMTIANTVNVPQTRTTHPNRLFWRVDKDTLIGRFYLRHTLCLKPERTDYTIGGPWDYSYRSEMCPSGSVAHLSDSDAYFVVELQPLTYEGKFITLGEPAPGAIAHSLAEWATAEQRANAHVPVIYHTKDIPAGAEAVLEESARYVRDIENRIPAPASPVSGHFYWLNCVQSIMAQLALAPERYANEVRHLISNLWNSPVFSPAFKAKGASLDQFPHMSDKDGSANLSQTLALLRAYIYLFGRLPYVYPWHPHFPDYRLLAQALSRKRAGSTLVILQPKRIQAVEWSRLPGNVVRTPLIMYRDLAELRDELKNFSTCIIHLPGKYDMLTGRLFDCLSQAMPAGSEIHIFFKVPLLNKRGFSPEQALLRHMHLGQKPGVRLIGFRSHNSIVRRFMDKYLGEIGSLLLRYRDRPLKMLWFGAQTAFLHLCYFLYNLISLLLPRSTPGNRNISSAVLSFRVEP